MPWIVAGDFNEILSNDEKEGQRLRAQSQLDNFRQALDECALMDLGFVGPKFTWNNGRAGEDHVRERIDRGICNKEWRDLFPMVRVHHLTSSVSDHRPLLLENSTIPNPTNTRKK